MGFASSAPAKVNLTLHVGPPQANGLHPLDSLVGFVDVGDALFACESDSLSLEIAGPFAAGLPTDETNLVIRAARALADAAGVAPRAAVFLTKRLPVASGIGGGSADAAAALRVLNVLWRVKASVADLEAIAAGLGADVPSCVQSRTVWMRGFGELLEPAEAPRLHLVLVNPLAPAATGAVYRAFDAMGGAGEDALTAWSAPADPEGFIDALAAGRNDLLAAALTVAPEIGLVLELLQDAAPGALVRMSGSGATCFALVPDRSDAARVAAAVTQLQPGWWVAAARLGAADISVTEREGAGP